MTAPTKGKSANAAGMPIRRRLDHDNLPVQKNVVLNISFFAFFSFLRKNSLKFLFCFAFVGQGIGGGVLVQAVGMARSAVA
ncbi:hypothetical protein [Azotobacter chroococcum]|uniref:hypothetical protein n=1 Tax=Azotobacter chroococcum TaxID=353 RepID=UPI0012FE5A61|nr:hypothetical protein [Azotobacter chroococcum]